MLQRTVLSIKSGCYNEYRCYNQRMLQRTVLSIKSGCYNEYRCCNERMLQRTVLSIKSGCYNEQLLSIKSECYNERRRYNERGRILSADVARACAWHVRPYRFDSFFKKVEKRPATDEVPTGQSPKMCRNNESSPSTCMWLFMICIGESVFIVFTKERVFVFFRFTCTA